MADRDTHEQVLVQRVVNGDQEAMKMVFRVYYPRMLYFILTVVDDRQEAEDLVQEALMNFWINLSQKKIVPESIERYLFRMVRNRSLNVLKRKHRIAAKSDDVKNSLLKDAEDMLEDIRIKEQLYFRIAQSFVHLTEAQQKVMNGIYVEGLSVQQISEQLDTTPNNVRNHKARAIERLRELFSMELILVFSVGLKIFSIFL